MQRALPGSFTVGSISSHSSAAKQSVTTLSPVSTSPSTQSVPFAVSTSKDLYLPLCFKVVPSRLAYIRKKSSPKSFYFSDILTTAFHRPNVLPITSSFTAANASNASLSIAYIEGPKQSLLVDYQINGWGWTCVAVLHDSKTECISTDTTKKMKSRLPTNICD
jgi:hypothetical protein